MGPCFVCFVLFVLFVCLFEGFLRLFLHSFVGNVCQSVSQTDSLLPVLSVLFYRLSVCLFCPPSLSLRFSTIKTFPFSDMSINLAKSPLLASLYNKLEVFKRLNLIDFLLFKKFPFPQTRTHTCGRAHLFPLKAETKLLRSG